MLHKVTLYKVRILEIQKIHRQETKCSVETQFNIKFMWVEMNNRSETKPRDSS